MHPCWERLQLVCSRVSVQLRETVLARVNVAGIHAALSSFTATWIVTVVVVFVMVEGVTVIV